MEPIYKTVVQNKVANRKKSNQEMLWVDSCNPVSNFRKIRGRSCTSFTFLCHYFVNSGTSTEQSENLTAANRGATGPNTFYSTITLVSTFIGLSDDSRH